MARLITLYKDGRSAHAAPHQVELLLSQGWSKEEPTTPRAAAKTVVASEPADGGQKVTVKKRPAKEG